MGLPFTDVLFICSSLVVQCVEHQPFASAIVCVIDLSVLRRRLDLSFLQLS